MAIAYIKPNAAGDKTQVRTQYPSSGAHWDKMDDPPGSPDDNSTYIRTKYVGPGDPPKPKQS